MVQGEDVGPFGVIVRDRSGPGNDWDGQRFWGVLVERSAGSSAVSAAARLWSLSAAIVGKGTTLEPPPPPPRRAPPGVFSTMCAQKHPSGQPLARVHPSSSAALSSSNRSPTSKASVLTGMAVGMRPAPVFKSPSRRHLHSEVHRHLVRT